MTRVAIRFSTKLGGPLVLELTSLPDHHVRVERAALTAGRPHGHGSYIVDDAYLNAVQGFIGSVKRLPAPLYVRVEATETTSPAADVKRNNDDPKVGCKGEVSKATAIRSRTHSPRHKSDVQAQ